MSPDSGKPKYNVEVMREVPSHDIPKIHSELGKSSDEAKAFDRAVATVVASLYENPWAGEPLVRKPGYEVLEGCRKVKFDVAGYKGKKRFRLVYRNDPNDGAIAVVLVVAVAKRASMGSYKAARSRL